MRRILKQRHTISRPYSNAANKQKSLRPYGERVQGEGTANAMKILSLTPTPLPQMGEGKAVAIFPPFLFFEYT